MPGLDHVLIIGAGLGGPAMALALARAGIRSTIYERRPTSQDIGGVLMLAPNAVRVLDKSLGIEPVIRPLGFSFSDIQMRGSSGTGGLEMIGSFGMTRAQEYKGITLRRPVLHNKLLELCEAEEMVRVEFGKALKTVREYEKGATVEFEDGTTATGDIVLGIDGIHSKTRQYILGDKAASYPAKYIQHVTLGSTIKSSLLNLPSLEPTFLYTPVGTILMFPTDPSGETMQWATFYPAPERDRKTWDEYRASGQALKDLREEWKSVTAEPFRTMLENLTSENMLVWAPYAIPDLPTWHTKRACLVGDSAHAVSPAGGQGTAQALEDVGLLARLLAEAKTTGVGGGKEGFEAVFARYEALRRPRLENVRKMTDSALISRAASASVATWWLKKTALKATFSAMDLVSGWMPRGNPIVSYDVMKEDIAIRA